MISSPLPATWLSKKVLLGASGFTAVVAAFLVFGAGNTPSFVSNGIPVPFIQQGSLLPGKVTFLTKRNNIDVYDVTFKNSEVKETLMPDRIYLVHIPNDVSITASPIDLAMSLAGTFSHDVDYYGYRYSDAAATFERRDIAATRFKDRFPGQFFASAKARAADAAHGNALANFETQNGVIFRRTDNVTGGVRIDPAGALYIIIANELNGIDMSPRSLVGCGNAVVDGLEQCDDGNVVDTDSCRNDCTVGIPLPFGSGSTNNGPALALTVRSLPAAKKTLSGDKNIALLKVDVSADTEPVRLQSLVLRAESGSLDNVESYALWKDKNSDGVVDQIIATGSVASSKLTFTLPTHSGAVIGSGQTILYEVRADVKSPLVGPQLRLAFATTQNNYVVAKLEHGSFPLVGIQTDTACPISACGIVVTQQPSTLWSFSDQQLLVSQLPLSATGTAFTDDQNRVLLRFSAESVKNAVSMKTLTFKIETGALLNAGYSLWIDSDLDGVPDSELITTTSQDIAGNAFTFSGSGSLALVAGGDTTIFEVRAHIAHVIIEPLVLRLGFATGSGNYVRAVVGTGALAGIKTNGFCPSGTCDIGVTTLLSTLWTLSGNLPQCGNSIKETPPEACDDGNTLSGDGCSAVCLFENVCGNSVTENPPEQCDDGNTANGDGCSSTCQTE